MPGTVKSELLPDADRLHKCDGQEKVCEIQHLPLDKSHFITVFEKVLVHSSNRHPCRKMSIHIFPHTYLSDLFHFAVPMISIYIIRHLHLNIKILIV